MNKVSVRLNHREREKTDTLIAPLYYVVDGCIVMHCIILLCVSNSEREFCLPGWTGENSLCYFIGVRRRNTETK